MWRKAEKNEKRHCSVAAWNQESLEAISYGRRQLVGKYSESEKGAEALLGGQLGAKHEPTNLLEPSEGCISCSEVKHDIFSLRGG